MEGDFINWAAVGRFAVLILNSTRRHKALFTSIWLGVVAIAVGLLAVLPKTYDVQTALQARRVEVLAALSDRGVPGEADTPSKQAAETILSHDNLVALVRQTDLVNQWPLHRAPLSRLKDRIWARLFPTPTLEQRTEAFVGLLQKQMWVSTSEGTVYIGIQFPDATLAFHLVEGALQNFLEARHAYEIASIADVIVILENRAAQSREALDEALQKLEALRATRAARMGKRPRHLVSPPLIGPHPDAKTEQLLVQIQSRRRAVADLEEFRRRRITELETKLEEQKALFAETHPAVIDLRQSLEAMKKGSPQVAALQEELAPMEAELKQRGLAPDVALKSNRARGPVVPAGVLDADDPREMEDPEIEYAKSQARHAITRYNNWLDRIESVRLEQDSAEAAFKYRYTIINPPQRPSGPVKPKPRLIIPASLIAGLLLGIIGTGLVDLCSRKVLERWQIEKTIGVPLLGEIRDL
jgi:uncharacterized protein involved in exopolysaccharide biosynthesis